MYRNIQCRSPFEYITVHPQTQDLMNTETKMEDTTFTSKVNRRCEKVVAHLAHIRDAMEVEDMSTPELATVVVTTAEIAQLSGDIHSRVSSELWSRPEYLKQHLHCEAPYDPTQAHERLRFLQPITDGTDDRPGNWRGFWFALKDEKDEYVLRIFGDKPELRDVVPMKDAHTKPFLLSRTSAFANRDNMADLATAHGCTLLEWMQTQTSERPENIVAMHFL